MYAVTPMPCSLPPFMTLRPFPSRKRCHESWPSFRLSSPTNSPTFVDSTKMENLSWIKPFTWSYSGGGTCNLYLFLVLFLEPLKTTDGFLLGQIGRRRRCARPVARLCLFSCTPCRGMCEVLRVEALLFVFWLGVFIRWRRSGHDKVRQKHTTVEGAKGVVGEDYR